MSDVILQIEDITKQFGTVKVLDHISLTVNRGEFITFLGPSGCGKTTTIRIIAGLETADGGTIRLQGEDVTQLEPNQRNVNTVFQNYALFPHMDVATNIAYGMKLRKVPKDEMKTRVNQVLELVQLSGYGERMPSELSGGQRQRVAIARAVVNNPQVLLLDEPLGALDLQLRRQMQIELKRLQKQLGITFVYITHDQEEAMNMSDRIVVMNQGRLEQVGTPTEIYDTPKTSFVASFVGTANLMTGTLQTIEDGIAKVMLPCKTIVSASAPQKIRQGTKVNIAVRSENIRLCRSGGEEGVPAVVSERSFVGGTLRIVLHGQEIGEIVSSRQGANSKVEPGEHVYVCWDAEHAVLVDVEEDYI